MPGDEYFQEAAIVRYRIARPDAACRHEPTDCLEPEGRRETVKSAGADPSFNRP